MNKSPVIIYLSIMSLLLLSGCVNSITGTKTDPIVGTWKYETPITIYLNHTGFSFTIPAYNGENFVIISYPNERYQFFENNTFQLQSGPVKILNDSSNNGPVVGWESNSYSTGTWVNIGDGNYTIRITESDGKAVDDSLIENDIYCMKNGYIQIISPIIVPNKLIPIG